jgi:hypothetical protein
MKWPILTALIMVITGLQLTGCGPKSVSPDKNIPDWLSAKIAAFEIEPNVPVVVSRWQYGGAVVYYFPPTVPDGMGCLYDETGKLIGCPDGGMTGDGDGSCRDFFSTRSKEYVVWRSD